MGVGRRKGPGTVDELQADCAKCFGLCCVALAFTRSADFPRDKAPGEACEHLDGSHRCGIHDRLRDRGYAGCTAYDCFGAGQKISRHTFGGRGWRDAEDGGRAMFAVLPVVRQLHELLRYLADVRALPAAERLHPAAAAAAERVEALSLGGADELLALDVAAERARVVPVLREASALARARFPRARALGGADLTGAKLRRADLRGAELRGALLMGADLRGADLRSADLIGADVRGADLRAADLRGALFVTATQLGAAAGDAATRLPPGLARPGHWT
ncbi:pentapeptide repeat-containing protein [Streptomyces sp. NRRL F-5123]|uniref:pentapeptide repeat-containing protein n=1 Tax=Streptomyces sp. NRRL F-5123 TaxID=1463856 RepID=UPI0004E16085|nr:pentapeptide repeat-containing protein [Streptomyces sp. NRRL F-5123]